MDLAARFEQYASDFELTKRDGDWSRVEQHFCQDAVREEHEPPLISLRHEGVEQIIGEWRQMIEKFDRRFDHALVVPLGRAQATGNEVRLRWIGVYAIDDAPALFGEGTEIAVYEGDRIKRLKTTMTAETIARNLDWIREHGQKLPPGLLEYALTLGPKGP